MSPPFQSHFCTFSHQKTAFFTSFCTAHFDIQEITLTFTFQMSVCKNQRIHIHKVFKGIAQRGKCSMGWFFGFKLHPICNEKGELLNFMITPGDVDDRKPLEYKAFVEFIYGKLVADKGYVSKNLFQRLFVDGI